MLVAKRQGVIGEWLIVIDVETEKIAVGGELHADAEKILLEQGSRHSSIWGANFYPWNEPDKRIEYTALINIRPKQDNPSMEILSEKIKMLGPFNQLKEC